MPGSFLTDDLNQLFSTDEFGTTAVWNGVSIPGVIFDDESIEATMGEGTVMILSQPKITGRSADFEGVALDDALLCNGETFTIKNWKPDGTGMIEIFLSRDSQ
jgi:hypothetical protein